MDPYERLKALITEIEAKAQAFEVDEAAFMITRLWGNDWRDIPSFFLTDNPRLTAAIKDDQPAGDPRPYAMLQLGSRRNDSDYVGQLSDLIIRWQTR